MGDEASDCREISLHGLLTFLCVLQAEAPNAFLLDSLFKDVGYTKGLQHAVTPSGQREACLLPII